MAGDENMVRLVSAKPPRIEGVEGGSATPSSTPTPKTTTWSEAEDKQRQRRGMPKQPKPVTVLTKPVSGGPETKGGIPAVKPEFSPIGKAATTLTALPKGRLFRPWEAQINYSGLGLNASPPGLSKPAMSTAQKIASRVLPTLEQFGSPHPFRGIRSGKLPGVALVAGSAMGVSNIQGNMTKDQLVQNFIDMQYPEDVANTMADRYVERYTAIGAAANLGAEGLADASFMAASSAVGAAIGSALFGIGALPGAAAGAAAGWAISRVATGASMLINMLEVGLGMGTIATGDGKMVNLPSIDDFWFHGGFDENGNTRNGFLGVNFRSFAGDLATNLALSQARAATDDEYPGRFLTDDQAITEEERILSGYYAFHTDVDPKYEAYKNFIQEGYFVYKDSRGDYKVNVAEVQEFLLNSVRYTQEEDLRTFLPQKSSVGEEFYKSVYLTEDALARMWDIPDVMP